MTKIDKPSLQHPHKPQERGPMHGVVTVFKKVKDSFDNCFVSCNEKQKYTIKDVDFLDEDIVKKIEEIESKARSIILDSSSKQPKDLVKAMRLILKTHFVTPNETTSKRDKYLIEAANEQSLERLDKMITHFMTSTQGAPDDFAKLIYKEYVRIKRDSFSRHPNMTNDFFEMKMNQTAEAVSTAICDPQCSFKDITLDMIGAGRKELAEIGTYKKNREEYGIERDYELITFLGQQYEAPRQELLDQLSQKEVLDSEKVTIYRPTCNNIPLTETYIYTDARPEVFLAVDPNGSKAALDQHTKLGLKEMENFEMHNLTSTPYMRHGQHVLTVGLRHTAPYCISKMNDIGQDFLNKFRDEMSCGNKEKAFKHAASLIYLFNHICPYGRGAASGGEVLAEALMKKLFPEKADISFKKSFTDFKAFHSSLQDFTDFLAKKVCFDMIDKINSDSEHFSIEIMKI